MIREPTYMVRQGFALMLFVLLASSWTACATRVAQEPEPPPMPATNIPAEHPPAAPETMEINEENLHFKGDTGREQAIARLDKAIAQHAAGPQDSNTLRMESLAELTQRHIVEARPEDAVLRIGVYPVDEANWALSFTIDEQDRLVNLVTETIEPSPAFE